FGRPRSSSTHALRGTGGPEHRGFSAKGPAAYRGLLVSCGTITSNGTIASSVPNIFSMDLASSTANTTRTSDTALVRRVQTGARTKEPELQQHPIALAR